MYTAVQLAFWLASDAQLQVKLADAMPLVFGFLVPASFTHGLTDLRRRRWWYAGAALVVLLVYDLVSAALIAKRDVLMGWYIIYPLGSFFLLGMLCGHSLLVTKLKRVTRRGDF